MSGGRQPLSLQENGCLRTGTIQHEFMHALGFTHEQCRSDRNRHITINYQNIKKGKSGNFVRRNTNNLQSDYNYASIMHYGRYAFSKNGRPTIVPNDPNARIGLRIGVSRNDLDTQRIRRFYNCGEGSSSRCVDEGASCSAWKKEGYCKTNKFTRENCKKTCGTC
ncbi:high choriolytic enzyme 2-like [Tubulanus polymorphus]|uniref:high choriolytic enzyme 2-like n=1 Tax=Tubulanus polymorphus TaxID=672921 RepID=UPI003DA1CD2B